MKKTVFIWLAIIAALAGIFLAMRSGNVYSTKTASLLALSRAGYAGDTNAVAALKTEGSNAAPSLIQLLKARDTFVQRQVWGNQSRLPQRAKKFLVKRVSPPQSRPTREAAAFALGVVGADARAAVPWLLQALQDKEGLVCWEAAKALGRMGKDAVPGLMAALTETNATVRQMGAFALGEIGPDAAAAVPALIERLNDPDEQVRKWTVRSLNLIGAPGTPALVETIERGTDSARENAAKTLAAYYVTLRRSQDALLRMAQSDAPANRRQAIETLRTLQIFDEAAVKAYTTALADASEEVRLAAIRALALAGPKADIAVDSLTSCLKDKSPMIQASAARALGSIGPAARVAIPDLERLKSDSVEGTRTAASEALVKIGSL